MRPGFTLYPATEDIAKLEALWALAKPLSEPRSKFDKEWYGPAGGWFRYQEDKDDQIHCRHARMDVCGRFLGDTSCEWEWPLWEYMMAACNAVPALLTYIHHLEGIAEAYGKHINPKPQEAP